MNIQEEQVGFKIGQWTLGGIVAVNLSKCKIIGFIPDWQEFILATKERDSEPLKCFVNSYNFDDKCVVLAGYENITCWMSVSEENFNTNRNTLTWFHNKDEAIKSALIDLCSIAYCEINLGCFPEDVKEESFVQFGDDRAVKNFEYYKEQLENASTDDLILEYDYYKQINS